MQNRMYGQYIEPPVTSLHLLSSSSMLLGLFCVSVPPEGGLILLIMSERKSQRSVATLPIKSSRSQKTKLHVRRLTFGLEPFH